MKHYCSRFLLTLCIICSLAAGRLVARQKASEIHVVIDAQATFVENKVLQNCRIVQSKLQLFAGETATLKAHFLNDVPYKFYVSRKSKSYDADEYYYFWKGRLIRIQRFTSYYDTKGKFVGMIFYEGMYFQNGKLVALRNINGQAVLTTLQERRKIEGENLSIANRLTVFGKAELLKKSSAQKGTKA